MNKFNHAAARITLISALALHAATANADWFVGTGAGLSQNLDYDCIDCGPIGTVDDSGAAYKVFGGFGFTPNFAVASGFAQLADTQATGPLPFTDQLKVNGPYLSAIGILPLGPNFELYASLGVFHWNQDVTFNGASGSFSGTDLTYSTGLGYSFALSGGPRITVQLEWQQFQDVGTNDAYFGHLDNYSLTTVNVIYRFQ